MTATKKYDFSGYATKNGIKCTDGRVIQQDAFKDNHGTTVPLVWQHLHNEPSNILGHGLLENRTDGVYIYGMFNNTPAGQNAKMLVQHGDITHLSIYANNLVEKSKQVLHGAIREVSLVMAGANPGAIIEHLSISHSDGSEVEIEDEAIIFTEEKLVFQEEIKHADDGEKEDMASQNLKHAEEETVEDVFNTLSEKQKNVVYALIAAINDDTTGDMEQSEGDNNVMKHNIFDGDGFEDNRPTLTHAQFAEIMSDAIACGSLRESFLAHAGTYGIDNIDYLFPDAKTITNEPTFIKRRTEWVNSVLSGTRHTPFSRIKSLHADITADAARAKGYIKGNLKKEEVFGLLKRVTTPTTFYKKQKLDRDDIVDITDVNVVAWLKAEMRLMLDEELARAILIGDGRAVESEDKISETNIRPIYSDDALYAPKVLLDSTDTIEDFIEAVIRSRETYEGSGSPVLYTTTALLTDMLLLKASGDGRRMYATQAELEAALRVSKIIEVPVMSGMNRDVTVPAPATYNLQAILVNLMDYTVGADKGGEVSMFDDFDIDYNQQKYLIEARCSGALTLPKSAIVFEKVAAAG